MTSTYLSLFTAPNYSGDNYDFWATKMQRFLMAIDLWDLVDKGFETPVANERLSEEQQEISKENLCRDAKALSFLQSAVSDKIFPYIMNATTAKQAWAILLEDNRGIIKREGIDWMDSMRAMQYHSVEKPNISGMSIVPQKLREENENSYEPKFISIGPRFRGTRRDLLKMEKIKWEFMSSLLRKVRDAESNLAKCGELILGLEKEVRENYVLKQMKWRDIANIMLYDACFIIELLHNRSPFFGYDYFLLYGEGEKILSDLMVLDNQIPFFILRELWCQLFDETSAHSIVTRALTLYGYKIPDETLLSAETKNASNFVELVHSYISMDQKDGQESNQLTLEINADIKPVQLDRCAAMLRAAGVNINLLGSDVVPGAFDFRIRFNSSSGTLDIPKLDIIETTKARWQNLIAWEHQKMGTNKPSICKCSSAALFFNALICCEGDVQLLKDKGIIDDYLGMSNKDLVTFFRSIIHAINQDKINSRYNIFDVLNKYYSHPIRHGTQIPFRFWHYLTPETGSPREVFRDLFNFLKRGYNYAATLVTIFTFIQTIYAVLSYHHPKK